MLQSEEKMKGLLPVAVQQVSIVKTINN